MDNESELQQAVREFIKSVDENGPDSYQLTSGTCIDALNRLRHAYAKTVVITLEVQDGHIDARSIFDRSVPATE